MRKGRGSKFIFSTSFFSLSESRKFYLIDISATSASALARGSAQAGFSNIQIKYLGGVL
jgi:hypothetical protein